jgi:NTP pyrophosphatase (non-canonical NTP hydrolase)
MYLGNHKITDNFFKDKFVLFCGNFESDSRRNLSDRLFFDYGGIPVEKYAAWVKVLVVGRMGESSSVYKQAKNDEERGSIVILSEQQFVDALDGKFIPHEPPKRESNTVVIYPVAPEYEMQDKLREIDFMDGKRQDYIAKRKPVGNQYDVRLQTEMKLCFPRSQVDMMRTALNEWGEAAQAYQTIEECAELIVALNKQVTRSKTPDSLKNVLDEIADVEMMLAQMRLTFGISDEMLAKRIKEKFGKLESYLKEWKKSHE